MTLATESAANRPPATTSTVFAAEPRGSYVDWGAVIAGAVVAAALSLVLLTFGSALGLGLTSLEPGEGVSPLWLAIAAAIWLLWVQVSSFMAGGYLAGRLRRPIGDAEPDEVDLREQRAASLAIHDRRVHDLQLLEVQHRRRDRHEHQVAGDHRHVRRRHDVTEARPHAAADHPSGQRPPVARIFAASGGSIP